MASGPGSMRRAVARNHAVRRVLNSYRHRGIQECDVLLASYPRSGNTWLKFMLCELLTGKPVDFDNSDSCCPSVGRQRLAPSVLPGGGRLIKSHEAFAPGSWNRSPRVLYLVRDGRDVGVSEFYYQLRLGLFTGSLDDFVIKFLRGSVNSYGSWQRHVTSWLDSGLDQMLTVKYEDLLEDPLKELARVCKFIHVEHRSATLNRIVSHNTAGEMRLKERRSSLLTVGVKAPIPVVRTAMNGGWRAELSDDSRRQFQIEAGSILGRLRYADEEHSDAVNSN